MGKIGILKAISLFSAFIVTFLSLECSAVASSLDIAVGGASIGAPFEVYERYKDYLLDTDEIPDNADLSGTILDGVYIDNVNLSGMTYSQALSSVHSYFDSLCGKKISLICNNGNETTVTAKDLGCRWTNEDIIKEALYYGKSGNLIAQYKNISDLQHQSQIFKLNTSFDKASIESVILKEASKYDTPARDASIKRENGKFVIEDGVTGIGVDAEASVSELVSKLSNWSKDDISFNLVIGEVKPKGTREMLEQITDVLGSYTTSFSTSSSDRSGNVRTGCRHIDGTLLYPGQQFSAYNTVSPFTEENGYYMAGSYLNGMVVESLGGGICQVSSTLYNAVIRAELQVDERSPHSMVVTYVDLSSDAAIAGTYKDFKFTNNTDYPVYIEGYTTEDKKITFKVYGHETRPSNRTIAFESVEVSKTEPEGEKIIADSSQNVGFIKTQSAHIGYSGELWKIVKIDGKETERIKLNKSNYSPSQRTATVGTKADNPEITNAMMSAIQSGSIDVCKSTIASLQAAAAGAAPAEGQ